MKEEDSKCLAMLLLDRELSDLVSADSLSQTFPGSDILLGARKKPAAGGEVHEQKSVEDKNNYDEDDRSCPGQRAADAESQYNSDKADNSRKIDEENPGVDLPINVHFRT